MSRSKDLSNAAWKKSSHSGGQGECVEVADLSDAVAIRDSKNPDGPALLFGRGSFAGLVGRIRTGQHDL